MAQNVEANDQGGIHETGDVTRVCMPPPAITQLFNRLEELASGALNLQRSIDQLECMGKRGRGETHPRVNSNDFTNPSGVLCHLSYSVFKGNGDQKYRDYQKVDSARELIKIMSASSSEVFLGKTCVLEAFKASSFEGNGKLEKIIAMGLTQDQKDRGNAPALLLSTNIASPEGGLAAGERVIEFVSKPLSWPTDKVELTQGMETLLNEFSSEISLLGIETTLGAEAARKKLVEIIVGEPDFEQSPAERLAEWLKHDGVEL